MYKIVLLVIAGLIFVSVLVYSMTFRGKSCGGFAANLPEYQCPFAYSCQTVADYPDASGTCQFSVGSALTGMMSR